MSANSLTPSFRPEVGSAGSPAGAPQTVNTGILYNLVVGPGGAATIAGGCEIVIFHPFDTASKRLMSYNQRVVDPSSFRGTVSTLNKVIFGSLEAKALADSTYRITPWERLKHLYPGSTYAVAYKVSQRVVKFAGQPYMRDYLRRHHSSLFFKRDTTTGGDYIHSGKGAMMLEATAGCFVGVSEVILLPFDRMKVLNQTNKRALAGRSIFSIIRAEGISKLYAGTVTTAVRNATGSFLLFGGTAFTKEYVFGLKNYSDATFAQNIVASTVGGCVGVFFTSPMDVVKTRVQSQTLSHRMSGRQVFLKTCREEGISAFYKGITPKIMTSAPRLVFSYTMTQYFVKFLRKETKGG